jgi:hypothetical protein
VLRQPAPVAPGLESAFTVELLAEQPGDFEGEVVVTTEHQRFTLTVSAKVLAAAQEAVPSAGDAVAS